MFLRLRSIILNLAAIFARIYFQLASRTMHSATGSLKARRELVAMSIIQFPQQPATQAVDRFSSAPLLPTTHNRHRGLHLVTAAAAAASATPDRRRRATQAQANRIVAQVEREIARKAFVEHQAKVSGLAPKMHSKAALLTLPVAKPESAASVAKRLLAALFAFAIPA